MTIEEMIEAMNGHLVEMRDAAPHVIAALKAAQAMYKDLDDHEAGYTAGQAAWDAATKGDEE